MIQGKRDKISGRERRKPSNRCLDVIESDMKMTDSTIVVSGEIIKWKLRTRLIDPKQLGETTKYKKKQHSKTD